MTELIFLIIGLVTGALIGYFWSRLNDRKSSTLSTRIHTLETEAATLSERLLQTSRQFDEAKGELSSLEGHNTSLQKDNTRLEAEVNMLKDKLSTFREELGREFELLSNRILDEKSVKFTDINKKQVSQILEPFEKEIKAFRDKVNETYLSETRERHTLQNEIKRLMELNQQLSSDARNLTKALTADTKTQGDWGEMILETILERSGLEKGREFSIQDAMRDTEGKLYKPDVIVHLPDERNIIIDSKVSLTDYDRFVNAETEEDQKRAIKQHVRSMRNHIDMLSSKRYTEYSGSLAFIFMFVPIEPAYYAAMQTDHELWNYAYNKGIILIGPANLIAALKLVSEIWSREKQNRNAQEIAEKAGGLYDKFVGFTDTLLELGRQIDKAGDGYRKALGQLKDGRGNLVNRAEQLRRMGASNKKQLDPQLSDHLQDGLDEEDTKELD